VASPNALVIRAITRGFEPATPLPSRCLFRSRLRPPDHRCGGAGGKGAGRGEASLAAGRAAPDGRRRGRAGERHMPFSGESRRVALAVPALASSERALNSTPKPRGSSRPVFAGRGATRVRGHDPRKRHAGQRLATAAGRRLYLAFRPAFDLQVFAAAIIPRKSETPRDDASSRPMHFPADGLCAPGVKALSNTPASA
jgi:hypothetical protein